MTFTIRLLADEDFRGAIVRGLLRRMPDLDVVRVQDVGLAEESDPVILEWAAEHDRVVLTHDASTMPEHAYDRLRAGLRIAGVCIVPQSLPLARCIEDLLLVAQCSFSDDWEGNVRYLPL